MSQACKHRAAILDGDATSVTEGIDSVPTIAQLIPGTRLAEAIQAVATAEANLVNAKKALAAAKKHMARTMQPPAT